MTDDDAVGALIADSPTHDVVVNAAGGNRPQRPISRHGDVRRLFALNVRGLFIVTQHGCGGCWPRSEPGVVVNVSSQMGHVGRRPGAVYCGTKHAVEGITKALGVELAPHGIRVVAVAPTCVETSLTSRSSRTPRSRRRAATIPIGRIGHPRRSRAPVFLAATAPRSSPARASSSTAAGPRGRSDDARVPEATATVPGEDAGRPRHRDHDPRGRKREGDDAVRRYADVRWVGSAVVPGRRGDRARRRAARPS